MARQSSEIEQLVDRCRKAGWRVVRASSGGYKVYNLDGVMMPAHLTYSDTRSFTNLRKALEGLGLLRDEETVRAAREQRKQQQAKVDEEAMVAATKRAQEQSSAVVRAAGPYLVEAENLDLEWCLKPHPAPWMRWVSIDAATAQTILDEANSNNRPIDKTQVRFYRDIMLARMWHRTHQGIAFDTAGVLQDGQHRLMALCAASTADPTVDPIIAAVWVGMPEENFKAIDEGKLRNARQLFSRDKEKSTAVLQSMMRLIHYLGEPNARSATRLRLPTQVILDEFAKDPERLREASQYGAHNGRLIYTSQGALGAAYYVLHQANGWDNPYVGAFFEGLLRGAYGHEDLDPRAVFRRRMLDIKLSNKKEQRRSALTQVGMLLHTWNNCVTDRRPRTLPFGDTNPIPSITRCLPGQGAAPEAFRGEL